ncbi:MAG: lipopolysaccharide biosynthesis protein, partial [Methanobacterium paludis]|nr:lipopolysaccharide biosynthesis protein [Methanobacterium paludis]
LLGLSFVGYYSAGYLLGNIISLLLSPFYTVLLPILSKYYAEKRIFEVKRLLNHSIKFFLMVSIPTAFGLSILAKPILLILSTPEIALNGYFITPIIALGGIFFGVYGIISQIVVLERKTQITGNIWILSTILNVILDITLGYRFGIMGVALTTLGVYILSFALTVIYSFKYIRCTFYFGFLAKSIWASVLMSIVLVISNPKSPLDIILSALMCSVIYILILWVLGGIRKNEVIFFKSVLLDILVAIYKPFKNLGWFSK